jgi:hypothetical protein
MQRLVVALVLAAGVRSAAALTAHLITDASLVNKTPGEDVRIGTDDDEIFTGGWGPGDEGPNTHGAASFALLYGSSGAPTPTYGTAPYLSYGFDYALFVDGTITFTPNYSRSSANDLVLTITGGSLRSTAEFNYGGNRGEATSAGLLGVGHYDPTAGSATVQLSGTFSTTDGAPAIALGNQTLAADPGTAVIVLHSSFGSSGNVYVDAVLTPLVPPTATAIVLVEFTGRVDEATHQDWPTHGVLAAYTDENLGCTDVFPALLCPGGTTTTVPGGGGVTTTTVPCATYAGCEPAVLAALPVPSAVAKKARPTARMLAALEHAASANVARAASATGPKHARLVKRARSGLGRLLAKARAADRKGRLGVALAPLEAAVTQLLTFVV